MTKGSGLRKYDYVCPLLQSTNDHVTRARKSFLWFRAFNQMTSTFLLSDSVIFLLENSACISYSSETNCKKTLRHQVIILIMLFFSNWLSVKRSNKA